ncbi:ATP-grasp ribosomal peptide maturase [Actinoallomurus sp. CA-142502]|uniref:ATP-grasp ribosomal peptide maturase n=1 Tax=Actinoallomurus sp. CA-142502 TaxID=3239885 RepID=UPI003D94872B
MTVLILTDERDWTGDRVAVELAGRGVPAVRLDPADFPTRVSLTAGVGTARPWSGVIVDRETGQDLVQLDDVRAVYYRRPTQFRLEEGMSGPEQVFAYREARRGFGGVIQALRHCLWLNDPIAAARTEYKPVQLEAASACGLTIPETLITSDPQRAYDWATNLGRPIIYKPMGSVWHADENQLRMLYTTEVTDRQELLEPGLARTAQLFQEKVTKEFEARAVVVGQEVFAVRIDAGSESARGDWRSDYDALSYTDLTLPSDLCSALVEVHERLGLIFGAVDLIFDGEHWVFLETNQNGEWGWLTAETGAPIASTVADLLEKGVA